MPTIAVTLPPASGPERGAIRDGISSAIAELSGDLGLPVAPALDVTSEEGPETSGGVPVEWRGPGSEEVSRTVARYAWTAWRNQGLLLAPYLSDHPADIQAVLMEAARAGLTLAQLENLHVDGDAPADDIWWHTLDLHPIGWDILLPEAEVTERTAPMVVARDVPQITHGVRQLAADSGVSIPAPRAIEADADLAAGHLRLRIGAVRTPSIPVPGLDDPHDPNADFRAIYHLLRRGLACFVDPVSALRSWFAEPGTRGEPIRRLRDAEANGASIVDVARLSRALLDEGVSVRYAAPLVKAIRAAREFGRTPAERSAASPGKRAPGSSSADRGASYPLPGAPEVELPPGLTGRPLEIALARAELVPALLAHQTAFGKQTLDVVELGPEACVELDAALADGVPPAPILDALSPDVPLAVPVQYQRSISDRLRPYVPELLVVSRAEIAALKVRSVPLDGRGGAKGERNKDNGAGPRS